MLSNERNVLSLSLEERFSRSLAGTDEKTQMEKMGVYFFFTNPLVKVRIIELSPLMTYSVLFVISRY